MDYHERGDVSILPALTAYHNDDSLANILSMKEVAKYYRVVMDTEQRNSIYIFISAPEYFEFEQIGNGLYWFDTQPKTTDTHTCLFSAVTTQGKLRQFKLNDMFIFIKVMIILFFTQS